MTASARRQSVRDRVHWQSDGRKELTIGEQKGEIDKECVTQEQ